MSYMMNPRTVYLAHDARYAAQPVRGTEKLLNMVSYDLNQQETTKKRTIQKLVQQGSTLQTIQRAYATR